MAIMKKNATTRSRRGPHMKNGTTSSTKKVNSAHSWCAQIGSWCTYQPSHVGIGAVS